MTVSGDRSCRCSVPAEWERSTSRAIATGPDRRAENPAWRFRDGPGPHATLHARSEGRIRAEPSECATIYDVGESDGINFIVMEHVERETTWRESVVGRHRRRLSISPCAWPRKFRRRSEHMRALRCLEQVASPVHHFRPRQMQALDARRKRARKQERWSRRRRCDGEPEEGARRQPSSDYRTRFNRFAGDQRLEEGTHACA